MAYVFTEPASGWANMTPTAELAASDGAAGYQFASTVSISGDTVVVGSFAATVDGHEGQGAAYVFAEPASGWTNMTQTAELAASDAAAGSEFGVAVTISGNTLVVGSLFANSGHGAVYAFTGSGSAWAQTAEYIGSNSDYLGYSVAIDGNTLVSGAYGSNTVYVATDASPPTATTSLQASASLAGIGQTVTLTATVASPAVGTPTGTVTFEDNGVALPGGSAVPLVAGTAVFSISTLDVGNHEITAVYSGDNNFFASTSAAAECTVVAASDIWINPAGGNWDNPNNWSAGVVPGFGDQAYIGVLDSGATVTHTQPDQDAVGSLTSQAPIAISAGSLALGSTSLVNNRLTLSGGVLSSAADLTVDGSFTCSAGTVSGGGTGSLTAEGGMDISGNVIVDGLTLNNAGTAALDNATLSMQDGATINNATGATFTFDDGLIVGTGIGAPNLFDNQGTIFSENGGGIHVDALQRGNDQSRVRGIRPNRGNE